MRALHDDIPAIDFVDDEIYLGFEDYDEPKRKRHLMQLWVAYLPERRRTLSPLLEERYRYVEAGGIPAKGQEPYAQDC
jgi:hypothetical protein